jgi:hypothetical protein
VTAYELVQLQAKDGGIWFDADYASEAYLQQCLRDLHEAVEAEHAGKPFELPGYEPCE